MTPLDRRSALPGSPTYTRGCNRSHNPRSAGRRFVQAPSVRTLLRSVANRKIRRATPPSSPMARDGTISTRRLRRNVRVEMAVSDTVSAQSPPMLQVADAQAIVRQFVRPLPPEPMALTSAALGHVLAADVLS